MASAKSKTVLYSSAGSFRQAQRIAPHRLTAQDFGCVYTFYQQNVPNDTGMGL